MSDFSDTYHLRTSHVEDAVALLRRAGIQGFVLPETEEWVLIVPSGEVFVPNQKLIAANQGELLHFIYVEDHGWGFELYKGSDEVLGYACSWDQVITVERSMDYSALIERQPAFGERYSQEQLQRLFEPNSLEMLFDLSPADACADVFGLKYVHWIRYDQLCSDLKSGAQELPPQLMPIEAEDADQPQPPSQ